MKPVFSILIFTFLFANCTDDTSGQVSPNPPMQNSGWLVPIEQVFDGGPGKDGIPSIDQPKFSAVEDIDFLDDDDLILGIRIGTVIKGYPHPILDWHEIVNDEIANESIAVTYCPLTGTGIGWNRNINGQITEFGVSGLLYNSNLMPYDRATNSTWSQQRLDCVNGANIGMEADLFSFIETSWKTWKEAFPESEVLNTDTGISRAYGRYPYGDYRTNHSKLLFPVEEMDDTFLAKDRLLGVRINGDFKAYPFGGNSGESDLVKDNFSGANLLIVRNEERNFIVAFENNNSQVDFFAAGQEDFPAILYDSDGTYYDLFGNATDGSGKTLDRPDQFIGFWFSWPAFYPQILLYDE